MISAPSPLLLCKDCRHYVHVAFVTVPYSCWHPSVAVPEPVNGYRQCIPCGEVRKHYGMCKPEAILFEAKDTPSP